MSINVQNTADIKGNKLNVLIYGPSGAGKTRFSGTCSPRFKPLILSAESGLLSLKQTGQTFDYVKIDKWEQVEEVRLELRHGKSKYDTVIIDSVTEIQQVCMDRILREERIEKARIQDWGTLNQRMAATIRDFRDMDHNLIVTALSDTQNDEETGSSRILPMVQGKLREQLAGYFDLVVYLNVRAVRDEKTGQVSYDRKLLTQGTTKLIAKDRSGLLSPQENPDFCAIYDKVFQSKKEVIK